MDLDDNINKIKSYLKKIHILCATQATFSFGAWRLIEKERIDDLLCCFITMLPKEYLDMAKNKKISSSCKSIVAYNTFSKIIKNPFVLNKNLYIIDYNKIDNLLTVFITNYVNDMRYIRKMFA